MRCRGFSLIELMVVVAITAILLAIGLPSFQGSLRSNRVATATNELMASFALARSEAIRSPGGAVICSTQNGTSCGGDWNDGWMVWIDMDGDGLPTGTNDHVLRYIEGNAKLDVTMTTVAADPSTVAFDTRGRRDGPLRTITIEPDVCPDGHDLVRNLAVGATGQVTVTKGNCS